MQIVKDGDQWLANQKTTAAFFGISIQAFQRWNYEPVKKKGRSVYYDVRAIQNDLDDRGRSADEELDLTAERARLAKEQADKTEMENQVRRGELVETESVIQVVTEVIQAAKSKLLAIPSQIARYLEHQDAQIIESQLHDAIRDALAETAEHPFQSVESAEADDGKPVGRQRKKAKRRGKRTAREMAH